MKPDDNGILGEGLFFERKIFFIDDENKWQRNSRENSLSKISYFKLSAGNSLSLFPVGETRWQRNYQRNSLSKDDIKRMSNLKLLNCLIS